MLTRVDVSRTLACPTVPHSFTEGGGGDSRCPLLDKTMEDATRRPLSVAKLQTARRSHGRPQPEARVERLRPLAVEVERASRLARRPWASQLQPPPRNQPCRGYEKSWTRNDLQGYLAHKNTPPSKTLQYRGTSVDENAPPLGPYRRPMPRVLGSPRGLRIFLWARYPCRAMPKALWWPRGVGGGGLSYERGTPLFLQQGESWEQRTTLGAVRVLNFEELVPMPQESGSAGRFKKKPFLGGLGCQTVCSGFSLVGSRT